MTFVPKMMSTLATSTEPAEHGRGEGHGVWGHARPTGHAVAEASGSAPAGAHMTADAERMEETAGADVAQAGHAAPGKANGKRTGRAGADGSPSFAAELAKNVTSGADSDEHADVPGEDDLLDEQESLPAHAGAADGPAATPGELFRGAREGHAAQPPQEPLPSATRVATSPAPSADLPRAVVNGSDETPKSDAMPVSPRVSTDSHIHAHAGEATHAPLTDRPAVASALILPGLEGEAAPSAAGAAPSFAAGEAPDRTTPAAQAADELAQVPRAQAPNAGAFVDRATPPVASTSRHTSLQQAPAPAHPVANPVANPVTAPAALPRQALHAQITGAAAPQTPSPEQPSHEAPSKELPHAERSKVVQPESRSAAGPAPAPHAGSPAPRFAPSSSGIAAFAPPSGQGTPAAQPVAGPARVDVPRVAPPLTAPSRSAARAGVVYAQAAREGAPVAKVTKATAGSSAPVRGAVAPLAQTSPSHGASPPSTVRADAPAETPASPARPSTRTDAGAPFRRQQPAAFGPRSEAAATPAAIGAPVGTPAAAAAPAASSDGLASVLSHGGHVVAGAAAPAAPPAPAGARADLSHPTHADAPTADATPKRHAPPSSPAHHESAAAPASAPVGSAAPIAPIAPTAPVPSSSGPEASPRRDGAAARLQAPARASAAEPSPAIHVPTVEGAPPAPRSGDVGPHRSPEFFAKAPAAVPSQIPTGSGVTATGESTAAHPTPLVDSSSANPPLFRLSDTRRVQAAHLDLAQQSYQPGTVTTSSPSAKGFDTGTKSDKAGKIKKSRRPEIAREAAPAFAPLATGVPSPAVPAPPAFVRAAGQPQAPRLDASRPSAPSSHAARPADAIHELASAGSAAPIVAGTAPAASLLSHLPGGAAAGQRRDTQSPFMDAMTPALRDAPAVEREAKRSDDAPRAVAPATETRPAHQQPAVTADKAPAPAPLPAHAQPASPGAPQAPSAPAAAPQPPIAARPLYDLATADPSLHATALGKNAHLHLETAGAGPLSLHLTVQDGVADLEVEGPAADRLKMRPEELRRALAGEGLTLGHFASRVNETSDARTQHDGAPAQNQGAQQQSQDDRPRQSDGAPRPAATPFNAQSGASSYGGEGRRHWQSEGGDAAERDLRPGASPSNGGTTSSNSDAPTGRRRGVHVTA